MNISDRFKILNGMMHLAENAGDLTEKQVEEFQRELTELQKVDEWLKEECSRLSVMYIKRDIFSQKQYFVMKNTSGYDFRYFRAVIDMIVDGRNAGSFTIQTKNWKHGKSAKLNFAAKIPENAVLSMDPMNADYEKI